MEFIQSCDDLSIVLMDIQMPVMSGLEATLIIREMKGPKSGLPVIGLTANAVEGDKENYLSQASQAMYQSHSDVLSWLQGEPAPHN